MLLDNLRDTPDRCVALASYARLAQDYDDSCGWLGRMRFEALELLAASEGETVIDVACGTGAMLPALGRAVGRRGRVIGIEQCPEMAAVARDRVEQAGLGSVRIVVAPAEEARLEALADAVLFFYTHDVLQSERALQQVLGGARPGARVVAAGARFLPWWWGAPLNFWTAARARRCLTTYHGLSRPWRFLERFVPNFALVGSNFVGTAYLGSGTYDEAGCKVLAADRTMERMA